MPSTMKEIMIENEWYEISEDFYQDKKIEKCFTFLSDTYKSY